jgi:serine/threonine protein kinase
LTASERIDIAVGVALGLHYLHQPDSERNKPSIFHRDVKSANILLDADGYAKIADAGIAREADSSVTMTGGMGTSGYIDPEYFETGDFTTASDVFSYGVVLLELLTGLQAFDSTQNGRNKKLFQRARRTVVPADVRAGLDEARETLLRDLAMECTAEDIEERPGLEDCVARLLGEVMEAEPDVVPPPPAPAPAPRVREVSTGSRSM